MAAVIVPLTLAGIVAILLMPPYIIALMKVYGAWRIGITRFAGTQIPKISKAHLVYLIRKARNQLIIKCGSLQPYVWDSDIGQELLSALQRHQELKIRILTGPFISRFEDKENPVYVTYLSNKEKYSTDGRWQIRHLKTFPHKGQGRFADGDLYIEPYDDEDSTQKAFQTEYRDFGVRYNTELVDAWLKHFERCWSDTNQQIETPEVRVVSKLAETTSGNAA